MSDENRKEQPAEMSPEFRAWHESVQKLTLGGAKGAAPKAPLNEHVWIGYCDLCNGQHCVTIEKADANVTRRPHSDSLARAHAEGLEAGRREGLLIGARLAHEWGAFGVGSKLYSMIPAAPEVIK